MRYPNQPTTITLTLNERQLAVLTTALVLFETQQAEWIHNGSRAVDSAHEFEVALWRDAATLRRTINHMKQGA